MKLDLSKMATLKDKLKNGKDFGDIWEYFLDHFGEVPAFFDVGSRIEHPMLEATLPELAAQVVGKKVTLNNLLLVGLPEYKFVHGGCMVAGKPLNVLYFDDLGMGLMAYVASFIPSETKFVRFRGQILPYSPRANAN